MAIVMQITIQQDATGVSTNIKAGGPCTELEAVHAAFLHQTIIAALESKEGFKHNGPTVCETKEIQPIDRENNNVH